MYTIIESARAKNNKEESNKRKKKEMALHRLMPGLVEVKYDDHEAQKLEKPP